MPIGHGWQIGGMAAHDNAVLRIELELRHVAHHAGDKLDDGTLSAVGAAPAQFLLSAPLYQPHDAHSRKLNTNIP